MSCLANADLAVSGGILGAAAVRVRFRRRRWPARLRLARRAPREVPAET